MYDSKVGINTATRVLQRGTMKTRLVWVCFVSAILLCDTAYGDDEKKASWKADRMRMSHIYTTRPRRVDVPLRAENISDEEVREIQAVTATVYPGALANIAGVVDGCPCEEGPLCTSQVWVVAYKDSQYDGLMLSRVDKTWTVGQVQSWWLKYDSLRKRISDVWSSKAPDARDRYRKLLDDQYRLQQEFPVCEARFPN